MIHGHRARLPNRLAGQITVTSLFYMDNGTAASIKARESDFEVITMQDSEDAIKEFTSVDEREREVSWRSHREVTCKTCHSLAMSFCGED